MVEKQQKDTEK